jgi:hypothetical protein
MTNSGQVNRKRHRSIIRFEKGVLMPLTILNLIMFVYFVSIFRWSGVLVCIVFALLVGHIGQSVNSALTLNQLGNKEVFREVEGKEDFDPDVSYVLGKAILSLVVIVSLFVLYLYLK